MEESINNTEKGEKTPGYVQEYLDNLGLDISKLKGNILDIGAGDGELALYLSENINLNVIAIDTDIREDSKFNVIKGDVQNLSFENESIDTIISHASIPNIFLSLYSFEFPELSEDEIKKAVNKSFNEILRVLKVNGEAYLAPIILSDNYESQKMLKKVIIDEIDALNTKVHKTSIEYIKNEVNKENGEITKFYRIKIIK